MKVVEIAAALSALSTQLTKVQSEIIAKIDARETALSDIELPEEAISALADLAEKVKTLHDIVTDPV